MSTTAQTPRKKAVRVSALKTIQDVGIEMARTYRAMKRGEINTSDGYRMVMALAALKACLESSELEKRLAELEASVSRGEVVPFRPKAVS